MTYDNWKTTNPDDQWLESHPQPKWYIYDTIFDPADDHNPWIAIKVYRDGNPIHLARFPTEDEADDFINDIKVNDELFDKEL